MRIFLFVPLLFSALSAMSQTLVLNDQTTDITFVTRHAIARLEGAFKGVSGTAVIDSNNLPGSFLKLAFAASTVTQNDYQFGPDLLKAGCFNPSKFPQIELSSTAITKLPGLNRYRFTGTLRVKGITKNIVFPFTATPNVGGFDFLFTFPLAKRAYKLHCAIKKKFKITVKGYGKKIIQ